jgi:hypothetical protein
MNMSAHRQDNNQNNILIMSKGRLNILLVLLSLMLKTGSGYSQSANENLKKYNYYRWRLKQYFTYQGSEPGESLIAGIWGKNNTGKPDYGDGTVYLGWYIGVLATELNLLLNNNQDITSVTEELFFALDAINRLDKNAEQIIIYDDEKFNPPEGNIINPNPSNSFPLNGYFTRSDIPQNYFESDNINGEKHFKHHNYMLSKTAGNYCDQVMDSARCIHDWGCLNESAEKNINRIAFSGGQDQFTNLLIGLALVKKLVPESLSYAHRNFIESNSSNLVEESKRITSRIMDRVIGENWFLKTGWGQQVPEGHGGYWGALKFGFGEAASYITENNLYSIVGAGPYSGTTPSDINAAFGISNVWVGSLSWLISRFLLNTPLINGATVWTYIASLNPLTALPAPHLPLTPILINLLQKQDNRHMILTLMSIGNTEGNLATPPSIAFIADFEDWGSFYSLLNKVLHPGNPFVFSHQEIENQLNSAPCTGPFCIKHADCNSISITPHGWGSSLRYIKDIPSQNNGSQQDHFTGYYTGLDYMLLFNLYCIKNQSYVSNYQLTDNINLSVGLPAFSPPTGTFGNSNNPANFEAFNQISSSQTLASNADVHYRAGKEIILKPGFYSAAGSNFSAIIDPFECENGEYKLMLGEGTEYSSVMNSNDKPQGNLMVAVHSESSTNEETSAKFELFPNPNDGSFNVLFKNANNQLITLRIYNLMGLLLYEKQVRTNETNIQVNPNGLDNGCYILSVGNLGTRKFIVLKN